jgi:SAM-dependent methyltransferase
MRARLLDLVVCPTCGGALVVEPWATERTDGASDEIVDGRLACSDCDSVYPVIAGVPRLLAPALVAELRPRYPDFFARHPDWPAAPPDAPPHPLAETMRSFTRQRLDLRPPGREDEAAWRRHLARVAGPLASRDQLDGRLVLDLGSGFGRHLFAAADLGAEVVGLDLSGGVDRAHANTRDLPKVHVVQADLFEPPLAPGRFDVAWSFGVLHHLPDPRAGFAALVRQARPDDGRVAIWVYGYEGMAFTYKLSHMRPLRRALASVGPRGRVLASQIVAAGLSVAYWLPLRIVESIAGGDRTRRLPLAEHVHHGWSSRVAAVHDRLSTPITHFHDRPELEDWFAGEGLTDVVVEDTERRGWRAQGRRSARNAPRPAGT